MRLSSLSFVCLKSKGHRLRRREQEERARPTRATNADKTTVQQMRRKVTEAGAKDDANLDLDTMALSKIEALTGMIRAQEEIETLLDRELDDLKSKHADARESVWRLLTRYSKSW